MNKWDVFFVIMFHFRSFRKTRVGLSLLLGLSGAVGLESFTPAPATAIPLEELIFPGVQLLQLYTISPEQRVQLGQSIHQQVLSNYQLNTDPQVNAYVDRIGQRLAAASDCSEYPFQFYVVQDDSINAFATTGGYVYVNTGLINATDNQDQLAGVLAHEIGHICNDDLIDQLKQTTLAQGAASVTGLDQSTLAEIAYTLAVGLPYSRRAEFAADTAGLAYVQQAGYDPRALPAFLTKLVQSPSVPVFLSSHPAPRDRIESLEEQIASNSP